MTMATPTASPAATRSGWDGAVAVALAAVVAGTTMSLGGYLPSTMEVAAPAVCAVAAAALIGGVFRQGVAAGRLDPIAWAPVPFLLLVLVNVLLLAPARWLGWREGWLWLQVALVFWLSVHLAARRPWRLLLALLLVALGVAGVALAAYQRLRDPLWLMLGREQVEQYAGRSAGMFGIPNSLAGLFELLLPASLLLAAARGQPRAWRAVAAVLALLLGIGLVLTVSRGGWVAVGIALIAAPLLYRASWGRRIAGMMLALVLVAAAVGAVYRYNGEVRGRFEPFLKGQLELSRPVMWRGAWEIWQDSPWFGVGAGSYEVLFDGRRPPNFQLKPRWAHNEYLETLSGLGLVGLGLFLAGMAAVARRGWRGVAEARSPVHAPETALDSLPVRLGLWLGLLAFCLHMLVDFHLRIPGLAFAAALAAGLLAARRSGASSVRSASPGRRLALAAAALALLALGLAVFRPAYRAEALRGEGRRQIDRASLGKERLDDAVATALPLLAKAVRLDPGNGQAWSDFSYATALSWHATKAPLRALGKSAEEAANRAIGCCAVQGEFWVRRGIALDMQGRREAAGESLLRAVQLAPRTAEYWYHHANHLALMPSRFREAREAVGTCLTLDPYYAPAKALLDRLERTQNPAH